MSVKKKKICLFSDHHISNNPRVWKEAFCWEKLGYDVEIVTMFTSKQALIKDKSILEGHQIQYSCFLNMIAEQQNILVRSFYRLKKKCFEFLFKKFGIVSPNILTYAPFLMLNRVLKSNADFFSAHMETAFWVGSKLIEKNKKVFFDIEDWYSHHYLVPGRPVKYLQYLEKSALQKGLFCVTTSEAMANAVKEFYHSEKQLYVIYNGFSTNENYVGKPKVVSSDVKRIVWFSQRVGPHRGIEQLVEALQYVHEPSELHLLGNVTPEYKSEIVSKISSITSHTVVFHDPIPHHELTTFLNQFDLGVATEMEVDENRKLTITNKILQYLQSGIKVLATNTPGQLEVQRYFPQIISLVGVNDTPQQWGEVISQAMKNTQVDIAKTHQTFNEIFSQEAQEQKWRALESKYMI